MDVVRRDSASTELGARVAALTGNKLCSAVATLNQQGLVAGSVPGRGQDLNTGSDLLVAVEDSSSAGFDVSPLGDGVVRQLCCDGSADWT